MTVYRISACILGLALAVLVAGVFTTLPHWAGIAAAAVAVAAFVVTLRAVRKPLQAVSNGIYLLREQDFSSRLRRVGQPDADRVVDFFNSLMATMKEERLKTKQRHKLLTLLIERSPMGVAMCDFDGNIESTNDAFDRFATPALKQALDELADGETRTVRFGAEGIYRISRLWIMDSGFRRPFFLVEQLADEIIEAEKNIFNRIVRTLGHEINNTLGSVISVTDSLASIHADDPEVSAVLHSCTDRCSGLVRFVSSYADIVKLPEPDFIDLDLNGFVPEMLPFLRTLLPDNIRLDTRLSADAPTVKADPVLLERVVVNAVKNSVESIAAASGTVTLATSAATLTVSDDGPGLTPEAAEAVFSPFFSTKRNGRGLGLMLIAEITRRHHAGCTLATDAATGLTSLTLTFPQRRR